MRTISNGLFGFLTAFFACATIPEIPIRTAVVPYVLTRRGTAWHGFGKGVVRRVDKLDCVIIYAMLNEHQAFSAIEGVTRKRIFDGLHVNYRTLHRRLSALEKKGCLARGVPEGLRHTYHVTEKGVKKFEEAIG